MGPETRELVRRLQASLNETIDALLALDDAALDAACSHPCAHGPGEAANIFHLLANDIDHERMHAGQVLSLRHDLRVMQTPAARLLGEWAKERGALIGTMIGLADADLDRRPKPEEWSIRDVVEHTLYWEENSTRAMLREQAGGGPWQPDPALDYAHPVPRPAS
jgi:hypothetical protein